MVITGAQRAPPVDRDSKRSALVLVYIYKQTLIEFKSLYDTIAYCDCY